MNNLQMDLKSQSIEDFFHDVNGDKNTFLIPNYQRQYSWGQTHCETMWDDIMNFCDSADPDSKEHYFLGSIVYFKDPERPTELQIIDGQQRITTLSLLFRALLDVVKTENSDVAKGLTTDFKKCLWVCTNQRSNTFDYESPLLVSEVATDEQRGVLKKILSENFDFDKDLTKKEKKSRYAENYKIFKKQIADTQRFSWADFCDAALSKLIVLPIECASQESALRIFTTLNNRGMPLTNADVFKGILYTCTPKALRDQFAQEWKNLEGEISVEKGGRRKGFIFDVDFLFTQYMHVERAREGNSGNEIALRDFFTKKNPETRQNQLEENPNQVFDDIKDLADLWLALHDLTVKMPQHQGLLSLQARQYLDILFQYPNEYWKYLTSAYYFWFKDNANKADFFKDENLLPFLKKVIATFFARFLKKPTVNEIKRPVFISYVDLFKNGGKLQFNITNEVKNNLPNEENFENPGRLLLALMTLWMYLKYPSQPVIDKKDREVEHILPRKWRESNYNGWSQESANAYLERLGNKMFLEDAVNIAAGNGYFGEKKAEYKKSKYLEAQAFVDYQKNDWLPEDILAREKEMFERIDAFFKENL